MKHGFGRRAGLHWASRGDWDMTMLYFKREERRIILVGVPFCLATLRPPRSPLPLQIMGRLNMSGEGDEKAVFRAS